MKKILITGAGGAGVFPIWNILKKKYKIFLADNDIDSIHPEIPNNIKLKIPLGNHKEFIDKFPTSKFLRDTEKLYTETQVKLKEINS